MNHKTNSKLCEQCNTRYNPMVENYHNDNTCYLYLKNLVDSITNDEVYKQTILESFYKQDLFKQSEQLLKLIDYSHKHNE